MNVGSLFSGIGGFDLGFERAGMRTEWFVEQDPYCQAVLRKHWPDVPVYGDVRAVSALDLRPVALLCGGFPCQDLSAAGKGAGLDGARSGLYAEVMRLIGDLRPGYVVLENVPVLRSRGLGRILGEMAALGYDAEWDCIPASAVGAPHRRDRIWIVAYPQRVELREQSGRCGGPDGTGASLAPVDGATRDLAHAEGVGRGAGSGQGGRWREGERLEAVDRSGDGGRPRQDVADAEGERSGAGLREARPIVDGDLSADGGSHRGAQDVADAPRDAEPGIRAAAGAEWERTRAVCEPGRACTGRRSVSWVTEPDVGRVAHGVPSRVDRLRALGNALVPQIAEEIGRRIMNFEEAQCRVASPTSR